MDTIIHHPARSVRIETREKYQKRDKGSISIGREQKDNQIMKQETYPLLCELDG